MLGIESRTRTNSTASSTGSTSDKKNATTAKGSSQTSGLLTPPVAVQPSKTDCTNDSPKPPKTNVYQIDEINGKEPFKNTFNQLLQNAANKEPIIMIVGGRKYKITLGDYDTFTAERKIPWYLKPFKPFIALANKLSRGGSLTRAQLISKKLNDLKKTTAEEISKESNSICSEARTLKTNLEKARDKCQSEKHKNAIDQACGLLEKYLTSLDTLEKTTESKKILEFKSISEEVQEINSIVSNNTFDVTNTGSTLIIRDGRLAVSDSLYLFTDGFEFKNLF